MYVPHKFLVSEHAVIDAFINDHSFGQLISNHQGRLWSSHLPFMYVKETQKLICHMAKANPQHLDIVDQQVMVTLTGDHGYVSPQWYVNESVPTWNYQAVHLYGTPQVFVDPERLIPVLEHLTHQHESAQAKPWNMNYPASLLNGIVGVEIDITEVVCKFKLSQNKTPADIQAVIDHLDPITQADLIKAMKNFLQ